VDVFTTKRVLLIQAEMCHICIVVEYISQVDVKNKACPKKTPQLPVYKSVGVSVGRSWRAGVSGGEDVTATKRNQILLSLRLRGIEFPLVSD
jgi:hypothetical protein